MDKTLIWLQEMEDNNENWVKISSVISMLKKEKQVTSNLKHLTFEEYLEENNLSQIYIWFSKRGMTDSAIEIHKDWQLTINVNI